MEICWGYKSTLFFYALRGVFRLDYPELRYRESSRSLSVVPEYMWCAMAPKGFALFDYLNKNLMYEVRFTILNPKSQIWNRKYSIICIRCMSWPYSYRNRWNCPESWSRFHCFLRTSQTQKISCGYGRSGRTGKITFSVPLRSENIRQISCCTDYIRIRIPA